MNWDTVGPYHRGFREFTAAYEAFSFEEIHRDAAPYLPTTPGLVLDVGAGTGRDAAWFASRGWDVVAVEPATALRQQATSLHPDPHIRWVDDRLPSLAAIHRLGLVFDVVWLSGVWQHIPPEERGRAMRKLATLLKPGGRMVLTLRHGPASDDRPMWPVNAHEVERLGLDHGLTLRVATEYRQAVVGSPDVRWQTVMLDLPDDGAGALPLLRGVILRQEKSTTYKLALLRCLARIADASPNVARESEAMVELPLGLLALYWLRMYKPLVEGNLPQAPGGVQLSFVRTAFAALRPLAPFDLRPGAIFRGELARALATALGDAAAVIATMPARHLTFADNTPVFPASRNRRPRAGDNLALNAAFFWDHGSIRVPQHVWQALRRMAAWIEPMLLAEWVRQTQGYAERAGRRVATDEVLGALRWLEPERDTEFVRRLVSTRLQHGEPLQCVWSGAPLRVRHVEIDHCLPWSGWPCNDLWNLLPASRASNQAKADRVIAAAPLAIAKPRIMSWWQCAYVDGDAATRLRFAEEARSTLPLPPDRALDLEALFGALDFRRLRLRQETQMPEWSGISHPA